MRIVTLIGGKNRLIHKLHNDIEMVRYALHKNCNNKNYHTKVKIELSVNIFIMNKNGI